MIVIPFLYLFLFYKLFGTINLVYYLMYVQFSSTLISITPCCDYLVRLLYGFEPVRTQREKDYLIPLFSEVYIEARKVSKKLPHDVAIYLDETMIINACAFGTRSIAVTRGMLESFSPMELKGAIAHELGHLANRDTALLNSILIGSGIISIMLGILKTIANLFAKIVKLYTDEKIFATLMKIIEYIFNTAYMLFIHPPQFLLTFYVRYAEKKADKFVYKIGYGDELIEALYTLYGSVLPSKLTLMERVTSSHPHITKRIERLENMDSWK